MPLTKKVKEPKPTPEQIAVRRTEPALAAAFTGVFRFLRLSRDIEHMETSYTVDQMLGGFKWYTPGDPDSEALWRPRIAKLEQAYQAAVTSAGKREVKRLGHKIRFTVQKKASVTIPVNRSSWDWIATKSSQAVVEITREQRETLQAIIAEAFAMGKRPDDIAKEIGKVVGLHSRYANAVLNRLNLMRENGMAEAQAQREARRYAEELKIARGKTIARTENKDAMEQGRMDAWAMLRDEGMIEPDAKKEWTAVMGSPRTSNVCLGLNGQIVGIDENFYSDVLGHEVERPPAHPNCRSVVRLILPGEE